MKRQYIVAMLALLGLGLVSTLALGTFTTDLSESIATETTLTYAGVLTLSEPVTTDITADNNLVVTMTVAGADSNTQVKFTIAPKATLSANLWHGSTGSDIEVVLMTGGSGGSIVQTLTITPPTADDLFSHAISMTGPQVFDTIVITMNGPVQTTQSGSDVVIETAYEELSVLIEDIS